jgi:hypothetical protein
MSVRSSSATERWPRDGDLLSTRTTGVPRFCRLASGVHADHRRDQHAVHLLLEHVQVAVLLARMVVAVAEDDRQAGLVRLVLDPAPRR